MIRVHVLRERTSFWSKENEKFPSPVPGIQMVRKN